MKNKCLICKHPVRLRFFPFSISDSVSSIKKDLFTHTKCLLKYLHLEMLVEAQKRIQQAKVAKEIAENCGLQSEIFTFSDPSKRMH